MIEDLDASLKAMLTGEATPGSALATAGISFAAPGQTWQGQGSGLQVNIYLYQIMDNRDLRSNQRNTVLNPDGSVTANLFPARIDCSYIITAWEKGSDVAGIDKEIAEHALLGEILYVLWRNPTIPARYLTGSLVNPELPLPVIAAENEDMAAKPDFWNALDGYVRPAITCRVTLAVDLNQDVSGPQVTTILTTVQQAGATASDQGDLFVEIGGIIRNADALTQTIPDAWILLDSSLLSTISDSTGAFRITGVRPGPHSLTVRAVGFAQGVRTFAVPDPSGFYDVSLTPL
jgi:Pvc16 N-terminal domain/Carboxypeptidase regulatory-like domain